MNVPTPNSVFDWFFGRIGTPDLPPPIEDDELLLRYQWRPVESNQTIEISAEIRRGAEWSLLEFNVDFRGFQDEDYAKLQGILGANLDRTEPDAEVPRNLMALLDWGLQKSIPDVHRRWVVIGQLFLLAPPAERIAEPIWPPPAAPGPYLHINLADWEVRIREALALPSEVHPETVIYPGRTTGPLTTSQATLESVIAPTRAYLDYMVIPDHRMRFHATIVQDRYPRVDIDFELSLPLLSEDDAAYLRQLPANREDWSLPQGDLLHFVSLLLDIYLTQQQVADPEKRKKLILYLMTHGFAPELEPPTRPGYGVSPGLLFIDRKTRARLWREHRIDVNRLQQESEQLFRDMDRFWEVIPREDMELSDRYFKQAARAFDRLSVAHHKKVKHVGELLKGDIREALITQAEWAIKEISARLPAQS